MLSRSALCSLVKVNTINRVRQGAGLGFQSIKSIHSFSINHSENRDKFGNLYEVPEYPFPKLQKNVHRPNETPKQLRARLVYQCRKRGILETDLILSTFAKEHLDKVSDQDCKDLDVFLEENDWDIYYWATEERTPPEQFSKMKVFQLLKEHTKNKGKQVRRMPDL